MLELVVAVANHGGKEHEMKGDQGKQEVAAVKRKKGLKRWSIGFGGGQKDEEEGEEEEEEEEKEKEEQEEELVAVRRRK